MSDRETGQVTEKEEARHRDKVQPNFGPIKETDPLSENQVDNVLEELQAMASPLRIPEFHGAHVAEAALDLQQTHGNKYVQRLAEGSKQTALDDGIVRRIEAQRGAGNSLGTDIRSQMESDFGHDFSRVKTHIDIKADRLAQELGARAFTLGNDIFFRQGAYEPDTENGKGLLRHELFHTVQQESISLVKPIKLSDPWDAAELEAKKAQQAVDQTAACTLSPAIVARQESTTKEAPAAAGAAAGSAAVASGADTRRREALRGLWGVSVIGPVQQAYDLMASGKGPLKDRATKAVDLMVATKGNISVVRPSYEDMPAVRELMRLCFSRAETLQVALMAHAGAKISMEDIVDLLSSGGWLQTNLNTIKGML